MSQIKEQVTIDDLPCKLKLVHRDKPINYSFVVITGAIILLIGFFTLIFGPDKVYYSSRNGLTLIKYFQLHPWTLIVLGQVTFVVGDFLSKGAVKQHQNAAKAKLRAAVRIKEDDIPPGYTLSLVPEDEPHIYWVSLTWAPYDNEHKTTAKTQE